MRCPDCFENTDHLEVSGIESFSGRYDIKAGITNTVPNKEVKEIDFMCPNCGFYICDTEEDAEKFLKTGTLPE